MDIQIMIHQLLSGYRKHVYGGIAMSFALLLPVLLGAAGMAVDVGESGHVRQRLCTALDSSVLAGASASMDENEIESTIENFFAQNYPQDAIGVASELDINVSSNEITASVTADYDTRFMRVLGRDAITIACSTTVQRNVKGLEVVMVLDNTGSMGGSNIATLKTSATNLVNILFANVQTPEDVRIGLVPYSASVNVGPYGIGEDLNGDPYGTAFVNNPQNKDYERYNTSEWNGCVFANPYDDDTTDNVGPWDMMSPYYYHYGYGNYYWSSCPQPITPITSNQQDLLDAIDDMGASGNTLGNFGMVWGYRVISPDFPFEEGSEYSDPEWNKAIIMMTDGNNYIGNSYAYTAYGYGFNHSVDNDDLNDRFSEVCDNAKDDGILIYTITFTSGISEDTKDFYRACATDLNHYYDAPTQDELEDVFEEIAYALAKLHIKN